MSAKAKNYAGGNPIWMPFDLQSSEVRKSTAGGRTSTSAHLSFPNREVGGRGTRALPKKMGSGGTLPSQRKITVACGYRSLHRTAMGLGSKYPYEPRVGRRRPVHGVRIDIGRPTIVFLTVCAKSRVPWMAQNPVRDSLVEIWRNEAQAWLTGEYLLMPDHLHLFCAPHDLRFTLKQWVAF